MNQENMNAFGVLLALAAAAPALCEKPTTPNVRGHQLTITERNVLIAHGDRLEKPGKEILTLTGVLDEYNGGGQKVSSVVTIRWEFPDKLTVSNATRNEQVQFNGSDVSKPGGNISEKDQDIVESMVHDTTDSFILGRFAGSSISLIGHGFNLQDPRSTNKLTGVCDLFQVAEEGGVRGKTSKTDKVYCFDPSTHYLKAVIYKDGGVLLETRASGWRLVSGNALPSVIQRYRNNALSLSLNITNAVFTGR